MDEDDWVSFSGWRENHLRSDNYKRLYTEPYDKDKPFCSLCMERLGRAQKRETPEEPNVLHIQRRIFI